MGLFDRSGYASLTDLRADGYQPLFDELEKVQAEFVERAPLFRDPAYKWGTDMLHGWARCWEYPFVFHHLLREQKANQPFKVADFGSGSTFFTIAAARRGIDILAFDNDPVSVRDLQKAVDVLGVGPGSVRVELSGDTLPCADAAVDAAYSISVLEHMADPVPVVAELARIVRPGGLLLVTLDSDVERSTAGVSPQHFERLRDALAAAFSFEYPEKIIHHFDVLTSKSSPWPRAGERYVPGLMWRTKDRRLLPLTGGPLPPIMSIYAAVMRRRP
jgi:SAM-dependent methyltransferase